MTSERWEHIQDLFDQALDLPAQEQESFLDRSCGDDQELKQEVLSLLKADSQMDSLLDGIAIDAVNLPALLGPSQEGQLIGPFQIVRELGQGGMGAVYLANRIDGQFDQQVAVKLIRRGYGQDRLLKKFQAERQIQARLSHPTIARLMGGGLTTEGLPYFTMEYVAGDSLDQYCQQHKLSLAERLSLFLQICEGVQYAHSKLVVHLDLKPSNLMVNEQGQVKILDFGVAKVLAEEDSHPSAPATTQFITPEYAAPEQVRKEEVGIPADIYSLGVVLYELLCGQRPYDLKQATPAEAERLIAEETVPLPSHRIIQDSGRIQSRHLQGDLDNICLKALRKEPDRRYRSVEAFAEDLKRYLEGKPVKARPATLAYRSQKYIKRNRWAVAGSTFSLLLLFSLVGFYTLQLRQERDKARLEAEKSQQVTAFLTSIFELADPEIAKGDTLTARELMDAGAARVEDELADQPLLKADMMDLMGVIYRKLGLFKEGIDWMEKALKIRTDLLGTDHLDRSKSLLHLGDAYLFLEDYAKADSNLEECIRIRETHHNPPHPQLAEAYDFLGRLRINQRRSDEAIGLLTRSLDMRQVLFEGDHYETAQSMQSLGVAYTIAHQGDPGVFWLESARNMRLNLDPEEGDRDPSLLRSLGTAYQADNNYEEAACYFHDALAVLKTRYGADHPKIPNYLRSLALLAADGGQYESAIGYYEEALRTAREVYGPQHRSVARYLAELGTVYYDLRQSEKALPYYEQALAINLTFPEPDAQRAVIYSNMAMSLEDMGKLQEAFGYYKRSYELDSLILGEKHPYLIVDCNYIGDLMERFGDEKAAERWYKHGLSFLEKGAPKEHWAPAGTYIFYGRLLTKQARYEEAYPMLEKGLDLRLRISPQGNPHVQKARMAMAEYHQATGAYQEAEDLMLVAIQHLIENMGEESPHTLQAQEQLEGLYAVWKK